MSRIQLIRAAFVTMAVIFFLHIFAIYFYLYSYTWWFDLPMHLLAGTFSGILSLWLYWPRMANAGSYRKFAIAVAGALAVGLAWEFFEYFAGITQNGIGSYPVDTAKDLIVDTAGGAGAYLYCVISGNFHKTR